MFVTDMSYSRYKTFKHFLRNINHYILNCIHKGCPLYLSISDISNDEYSFTYQIKSHLIYTIFIK